MHLFLSTEDGEQFLAEELRRAMPGVSPVALAPGLLGADFPIGSSASGMMAFARQFLPEAIEVKAPSINAWAERLFATVTERLPEQQPWRLHIAPHYGAAHAGMSRCELIRERLDELLQKKRRHLRRTWVKEPRVFAREDALVQLLLTGPEAGFLSVASAPLPWAWRGVVSPFPKGEVPIAEDKAAPSRAFAKVVEAELRLGRRIAADETCVDLGASPGSWSYVALHRGAQVIAVDRSPLREDLMRDARLKFMQGDAFKFRPDVTPVDWLLCDVIAAPQRSMDLLLEWVRERRARRFVVTIKFKGHDSSGAMRRPTRNSASTSLVKARLGAAVSSAMGTSPLGNGDNTARHE